VDRRKEEVDLERRRTMAGLCAMARAFSPASCLHRDRTLMQGATYCDHRWEVTRG
jgi:hypothetical protein